MLINIIKLDLSKNKLKELPDQFGDLVKLKHLDLYKNELQHLPLSFHKLKSLRWLDLKDNPLVPAIKEAAGQCLDSKQCLKCAKDIVQFYGMLQEKIDQERQVRETQRQKAKTEKQHNAQKTKAQPQDKKNKKSKNKKISASMPVLSEHKSTGSKVQESTLRKERKETNKCSMFSIFKYSIILMFCFMVGLSISTAAGSSLAESVLANISALWNNNLKRLPPYLENYGKKFENVLVECHNLIGNSTRNFIVILGRTKTEDNVFRKIIDKIYVAYENAVYMVYNFNENVEHKDGS